MKKILIKLSLALLAPALLFAALYAVIYNDAQRVPDNNPVNFLSRGAGKPGEKVVVCAGDSLTHGSVSVNYVDMLSRRLNPRGYLFINAGINSELAYNLNKRLPDIIKCNPDFVTILIGSNDANASMNEASAKQAIGEMNLPQRPDKRWFRDNLTEICKTLKLKTHARVALLSLPLFGEEPDNEAFRRAAEYSRVIKEVALSQNVEYIPLNEEMTRLLLARDQKPLLSYRGDTEFPLYVALFRHYVLRKSFDEIAEGNGFLFLTDLLHLNTRGASKVAELVEKLILMK